MNLIPWRGKQHDGAGGEPSPLVALRHEMDRLFDTFVREPFSTLDWPAWSQTAWAPAVDIVETENDVTVRAEVPGIDPKDLEVRVTGNQLVLSGEKKESTEEKGKNYYHSESRYGSFCRNVPLPEGVDTEHVEAEYAHGVLTLRLKKTQAATARRIEVKVK